MPDTAEIRIAPRFRGPPDSGNGGYVCGRLAAQLEGDVRVRLERPPPLDQLLRTQEAEDDCVELYAGELRIARAWPTRLELAPPDAPSWDEAVDAARRFRGHDEHVFPGCFVCGPERSDGDGLRIFPGPLGNGVAASPWVPDASLGDPQLRPEFVWAALDCPGVFSFPQPERRVLLLGELAAHLESPVRVGERCVVIGWEIEHVGRKHRTGTALFDSEGRCAGFALGTWIETESS